MFKFFMFTSVLTTTTCFSQNNNPTARQVQKAIDNSYQLSKTRIFTIPWIMCNQDSQFFKADTIQLYKNLSHNFFILDCCYWAVLSFEGKKDLTQTIEYAPAMDTSSPCADPKLIAAAPEPVRTRLNYKIINDSGHTNILTFENGTLLNIFQVLSIDKEPTGPEQELIERLTLKRIK